MPPRTQGLGTSSKLVVGEEARNSEGGGVSSRPWPCRHHRQAQRSPAEYTLKMDLIACGVNIKRALDPDFTWVGEWLGVKQREICTGKQRIAQKYNNN